MIEWYEFVYKRIHTHDIIMIYIYVYRCFLILHEFLFDKSIELQYRVLKIFQKKII